MVCVIGDGALTGGVAFEALNQAGHLRTPLVVILNDNEMSIRANVGALQLYLNRIRLDPTLTRLREDLEHRVARIPAIGRQAYRLGKDVKESMKALLVPGMLFEELGLAYIGVVDGHDLHALRESVRQAIDTRRPVVVHVKTVKGKGYEPAEARPDAFHGTGPVPPRQRGAQEPRRSGRRTPTRSARRWCAWPNATIASSRSPPR